MDSLHADSKLSLLDETTNATVRTPPSVRSTLHRIDAFTLGSGEMGNAKENSSEAESPWKTRKWFSHRAWEIEKSGLDQSKSQTSFQVTIQVVKVQEIL